MARAAKSKGSRISVLNWMGTILVCSIPGVNLFAFILMIIFAKTQAKRSYAIAALVLTAVIALLICAAFLFLPQQMSQLAATLRGGDAVVPPLNITG